MDFSHLQKLPGVNVRQESGHIAVHFSDLGSRQGLTLGFASPPSKEPPNMSDLAYVGGARLINAAANALTGISVIYQDEKLSQAGREEALNKLREKGIYARELALAGTEVMARVNAVAATERAFYSVPALEPTDAVGALIDSEIRTHWRSLDEPSRALLLKDPSERVLTALMRSPLLLPMGDTVREMLDVAWRSSVEGRRPEQAAELRRLIEWANWSRAIALQVPAIGRFHLGTDRQIASAVKDVPGGAAWFGVPPRLAA